MTGICSKCKPEGGADIDLVKIALNLGVGTAMGFFCQRCSIRAVYKDDQGCLHLAYEQEGTIEMFPSTIEELMN